MPGRGNKMDRKQIAVAAVVIVAAFGAWGVAEAAQPFGRHPALGGGDEALVRKVDANTFLVGHPAGGVFGHGHANGAHPATLVARRAPLDANAFIVQPPAAVTWTVAPAEANLVAAAR